MVDHKNLTVQFILVLRSPGLEKRKKSEAVQCVNAVCSVGQGHQSFHHVPHVFPQTAFCHGPRDLHLWHLQQEPRSENNEQPHTVHTLIHMWDTFKASLRLQRWGLILKDSFLF